jgi:exopolyphosphatase/guanosine-5'-triphosphate,3'-diphosphate pyrophosphatase
MARYAAIDIGSNSIRMQAAETAPGSPTRILASAREVTRLGESVFQTGRIGEEAMALASEVLSRLAAQYKALDVVGVRAVATSSARDARNQAEFLARASQAIGSPVEAISGREEARLIHAGVESRWPHPRERVLLIDIGGGSAEIIASENGRLVDAISKPLGAVRLRELFLAEDPPSARELHQMEDYIHGRLEGAVRRLGAGHWDRAIATSGTASAVACAINGVPRSKRDQADRLRATAGQVHRLYAKLSRLSLPERRKVRGIGPRRAEIIVPGVCTLARILDEFHLPRLNYSAAGVRDGIIADLAARGIGRELAALGREQRKELERVCLRYGVSLKHVRKVAALASTLFHAFQPLHQLPPAWGKLLEAAAFLHDTGHYVNDQSHHKHSYYLVSNSDIYGFTRPELEFVANLCRYHRKSMPSSDHANLRALGNGERQALLLLIPLIRLADNLDRSREQRVESVECQVRNGQAIVRLVASGDVELEQWAAARVADAFRQAYGRSLTVTRS